MAYPFEHILIRYNGFFGTAPGLDKWSAGMRFGLASAAPAYDAAKLQTFVNACHTAAATFHATAGAATGSQTFFNQVTGAQIGALGRYSPTTQLTVFSTPTATPGNGTAILPWNSASVISLRTAVPRGRGSNGRIYWPCLSLSITASTGRVASGLMSSRVNLFKTFVDACNTAANSYSPGMRLIVAGNVGGGIHAPVTSIRSDDRIDSIERRENDQPSVWTTAAVA